MVKIKGIDTQSLLSLVAGLAMGGGAGMAGGGGGIINLGGISGAGGERRVTEYPKEFAPDPFHIYPVAYIPGSPQFNAVGKSYKNTIERAAMQQSLEEHNAALLKYLRPGQSKKERQIAINLGREEEKRLPKWWNESNNREEFKVSSSAVSGIRVTPDGNVEVRWGDPAKAGSKKNPTGWYTFRQYPNTMEASKAAMELLQSPSIGRAVWPVKSRKPKNGGAGLGEWNAENYDGSYAV